MGITSAGFTASTTDELSIELGDNLRTAIGDPLLDTSSNSDTGILLQVIADAISRREQTLEGVYSEAWADGATGIQLERICALTGIQRKPATYSEVDVTLWGSVGLAVPAGTTFKANVTANSVATLAAKTLTITTITAGAFVVGNVYTILTAGTTDFTLIGAANNNVGTVFTATGVGTGTGTATIGTGTTRAKCTVTGAVQFDTGAALIIVTPVIGLTTATYATDEVILGSDIESYAALVERRRISFRAIGGSNVNAITGRVLALPDVSECYTYENSTDAVVDGIPAHAFETVVRGGLAESIGTAILTAKPAGVYCHGSNTTTAGAFVVGSAYTILTVGTTDFTLIGASANTVGVVFEATGVGTGTGTATNTLYAYDEIGTRRAVRYTIPSATNIWVKVSVETFGVRPTSLEQQIKDAIVATQGSYRLGNDVYSSRLMVPVLAVNPCITTVNYVYISTSSSPTVPTTIAISKRNYAAIADSRIEVVMTAASEL